jgi:hypothetical protein
LVPRPTIIRARATIPIQYRPVATVAPQKFTGKGNQAVGPIALRGGLAKFCTWYHGESNFVVYLVNRQGDPLDLVANDIGAATSSQAIKIPSTGQYLLNVMAEGTWTIQVEQ